ncbi:glycosyltransferase 61 family protein [Propylenella binzhouense]|uniref:Glycosyltransferase family 61 protein n=1 Tax=Propylenella binzhouense TaxID=2555902 RepID=A0A964T2J1_9HYPH|nr:glycosyltransferase family 61 protein [Propylenella binzhouense]MYZ47065.1 glycosyltransferase family 61 protein [Propylenella binzhouense]
MTTAYAGSGLPDCPVLFLPFAASPNVNWLKAPLKRMEPLLSAAGWGHRPIRLQLGPLRVRTLHVPERIAVFGTPIGQTGVHPIACEVYSNIRAAYACSGARHPIVARRPAGHMRAHPAEEALYDHWRRSGFEVIDGATLSPEEQARAFGSASALIGFSGSNLHNSIFCAMGTPVIEIGDRRAASRVEPRNATQWQISTVLGQPYRFVSGFHADGHTARTPGDLLDSLAALDLAEINSV